MKIFAGSAHPELAKEISAELKTKLGEIEISRFPNGEKRIHVLEEVKNQTGFIIQSTITDEDIIELCLIAGAIKRKGAKKVVAVSPWFGYSAQDKVFRPGEPLSAKVMARIFESSGVDEILIVDPHSGKIKGLFTIPVIILSALEIFSSLFKKKALKNHVVVALDLGDIERSLKFAKKLNLPLVLLQKTPRDIETGRVEFLGIKGKVANKNVLLFDDFISTGQTLIKSAKFLKREGVKEITACVTHYFSVKGLPGNLQKSLIDKIIVSNTLPVNKERKFPKLKVISIASMIAKAMKKVI